MGEYTAFSNPLQGVHADLTLLQFFAVRKTLEANMQMADLFPPGRVLWALRDGDLHPTHRIGAGSGRSSPKATRRQCVPL